MPKRKVMMLVPYKVRDLEGAALVGHHLKERYGFEVVYTNGYGIERKLLEADPDALVLDHLVWSFKAAEARLAKRLGLKVFMLPTEGLFQSPDVALKVVGMHHDVTALPDRIFSWGRYVQRAVLEAGLTAPDRIPVVGCPRFDLYANPYVGSVQPRDEFVRGLGFDHPSRPLVLWATNTPYATRDMRKIVNRYVRRSDWTERQVMDLVEDNRDQFAEHSRVIGKLARAHPEWNFIVKVHPAEWSHPYERLVRAHGNIRLAHTVPVRPFLVHCDLLLQRNCTTANEAWMLGKPVLNLEIGSYRREAQALYADGNEIVHSCAELERSVRKYLDGAPEQQRARETFIAEFYFAIDGKASERCADFIARDLLAANYGAEARAAKSAAVAQARREREAREDRRFTNRVKDVAGIPRSVSLRFWRRILPREGKWFGTWPTTEPEITQEMVEDVYAGYDAVLKESVA